MSRTKDYEITMLMSRARQLGEQLTDLAQKEPAYADILNETAKVLKELTFAVIYERGQEPWGVRRASEDF